SALGGLAVESRPMRRNAGTKAASSKKPAPELEIALRIVVVKPPAGVLFCVQGKIGEFLGATRSTGADLVFDVSVRVGESSIGDAPRLLGNVAQGPPHERFLYVNSGTCAGDMSSPWTRRAKIPLTSITKQQIARVAKSGRL